jgi:ABC-type branched-subunit amino acid transport system substrate-binding protein
MLVTLSLLTLSPAKAQQCDHPESVLTEAIKESPDRLVTVLEGQRLAEFLSNLRAAGRLTGGLPNVSKIYIVTAKMLDAKAVPHVWLFFIQGDCILASLPAVQSIVEEMLPPE